MERVASESNIADEPSRFAYKHLLAEGYVRECATVPEFLIEIVGIEDA